VVQLDGEDAPPGEEGEIRVQAPQLFRGYLDPELDAGAFDERGFFRTGDLGHVDSDGYLVITGRVKDVIIRKGENISAREIEELLLEHPKVADAVAVGLPDAERGERCCAVVVCRDPADPFDFEEMVAHLHERQLMTQKIPEQLELVAELPRNPSGKVIKQQLRERFADPQE
jgi:non-ribosomal peptide synthetase component E (peptide arylation enzyme)